MLRHHTRNVVFNKKSLQFYPEKLQMKKILILLTFFTTINSIDAQIEIGIKHDLNGISLNGYFDPIIYSPEKKIFKVHGSSSYDPGYYYDKQGNQVFGQIKFDNNKIWYWNKKSARGTKFKPDSINSFIIGIDSFLVVSNFSIKNTLKEKEEYAQYITEFNDITVLKHYNIKRDFYGDISTLIETYLIKHNGASKWDCFSKKNYKTIALKYFGDIPYLKTKISTDKYDKNKILSLIKEAEYYYKFQNQEIVRFDKYWQEVRKSIKSEYSAKIIDIKDSIWTFEYYKDSTKIYRVDYSSFYPNTKNGDFTAFYQNGNTRQIISYSDNKPGEIKTYKKNGLLSTHYEMILNEDEYSSKIDIDIKYNVVNDSLKTNILNSNKKSFLSLYDEVTGFVYKYKYNSNELHSVYRLLDKDTVFQITNPDYNFKINSLQKKFDYFMSEKNYDDSLSENPQGMILVSFLIDPKGYVVESTILNKVHPELDELVNKFINSNLLHNSKYRYKFKPFKKDKIRRYCEVVIPFDFSVNRFYRKPVNYYHFNHWQFHNQMIHQQMMNSIKLPTTPSMPRGF